MAGASKFACGLFFSWLAIARVVYAADAAGKNEAETNRYLVVSRTFPERIFVPAEKDPVAIPLQKMLDAALMTEVSLAKLKKFPGVDVVQSFAQEKWRSLPNKHEFVVWGITPQFLKGFKFGNLPDSPPTGILVTSKMMQGLAWKEGEPITMEEPSVMRRQLSGQVYGYDSPMSIAIAKGEDLALVPLESIMRGATPFILNPCILIRLKAGGNLVETKTALENFITKEAKATLKGSVLQLKSLDGFVR